MISARLLIYHISLFINRKRSSAKVDDLSNRVRITGVEPARGFPLEPKSSASANSAISAYILNKKSVPRGNRTPDNLIKSQVLYRLS